MMDEYKSLKKFSKKKEENSYRKVIFRFISQVMISAILLLVALILTKNVELKEKVYRYVYEDNLSFKKIESLYKKYFGAIIPEKEKENKGNNPVASEVMEYKEKEEIEGGVRLHFEGTKLITAVESGLVLFIGEKEGYGKTLILEQTDGVEAWYVGITDCNYKIYDYIEKKDILGNAEKDTIDIYFKKKGEVVSYQEYIF